MASIINIRGAKAVNDPSYRYKMPALIPKVEGRGNGIKTVIVNMTDIALALHRSPGEVTKFFGVEMAAQAKWVEEEERSVVNGAHTEKALQDALFKYIEVFVLCGNCKTPEVSKYKIKNDMIEMVCLGCGHRGFADPGHKLNTFILQMHKKAKKDKAGGDDKKKDKKAKKDKKDAEEGSGSDEEKSEKKDKKDKKEKKDKSEKKEKSDKKEKKEKKEKSEKSEKKEKKEEKEESGSGSDDKEGGSDDEGKWFTDTSEAAYEARIKEQMELEAQAAKQSMFMFNETEGALGDMEDEATEMLQLCITEVKEAVSGESPPTNPVLAALLLRLQVKFRFKPRHQVAIFFPACLTAQMVKGKELQKYLSVFSGMVTTKAARMELIAQSELHFGVTHSATKAHFPVALKFFYDNDLLEEADVMGWADGPARTNYTCSSVPEDLAQALRTSAKPFLDWLRAAEAESGSEEESSEEEEAAAGEESDDDIDGI